MIPQCSGRDDALCCVKMKVWLVWFHARPQVECNICVECEGRDGIQEGRWKPNSPHYCLSPWLGDTNFSKWGRHRLFPNSCNPYTTNRTTPTTKFYRIHVDKPWCPWIQTKVHFCFSYHEISLTYIFIMVPSICHSFSIFWLLSSSISEFILVIIIINKITIQKYWYSIFFSSHQ